MMSGYLLSFWLPISIIRKVLMFMSFIVGIVWNISMERMVLVVHIPWLLFFSANTWRSLIFYRQIGIRTKSLTLDRMRPDKIL
jgi:hypothetical protein